MQLEGLSSWVETTISYLMNCAKAVHSDKKVFANIYGPLLNQSLQLIVGFVGWFEIFISQDEQITGRPAALRWQ